MCASTAFQIGVAQRGSVVPGGEGDVIACTERRRDTSTLPAPIDIGNRRTNSQITLWSSSTGTEPHTRMMWRGVLGERRGEQRLGRTVFSRGGADARILMKRIVSGRARAMGRPMVWERTLGQDRKQEGVREWSAQRKERRPAKSQFYGQRYHCGDWQ